MDAADFERRARNPSLDRADLEMLRANALAKGNREFAAIAAEVLNERFPGTAKKSGGATPTTAVFLGRTEHFASGKDETSGSCSVFATIMSDFLRMRTAGTSARFEV